MYLIVQLLVPLCISVHLFRVIMCTFLQLDVVLLLHDLQLLVITILHVSFGLLEVIQACLKLNLIILNLFVDAVYLLLLMLELLFDLKLSANLVS